MPAIKAAFVATPWAVSPTSLAVVDQLRWLAGMGIQTVFGWVVGVDRIAPLEIMGREVIPAVAEL